MPNTRFGVLDKLAAQLGMLTQDQLATMLAQVSVEDLARTAGLAPKTIYRLRHKKNSPTLDTVEKLVAAVAKIRPDVLRAMRIKPATEAKAA